MSENTNYLNKQLNYFVNKLTQKEIAGITPQNIRATGNEIELVSNGTEYRIGFRFGEKGSLFAYAPFLSLPYISTKEIKSVAEENDVRVMEDYICKKLPSDINLSDMKDAATDLMITLIEGWQTEDYWQKR